MNKIKLKKAYIAFLLINGTLCIKGFNSVITLIFSMLCFTYIIIKNWKLYSFEFNIIDLMIWSIPLSFIDILGNNYGKTFLSWFNIYLIILIIRYLQNHRAKLVLNCNKLETMSLILIVISILPVLIPLDKLDGLKQYLNSIIIFIVIFIGSRTKDKVSKSEKMELIKSYATCTIISGIGVLMQIIIMRLFKIKLGNYQLFGGYRHAFGFLFTDYSFLSLYLISGALIIIFNNKLINKNIYINIASVFLLLLTSILTSARTGIFAFIVTFGIYSIVYIIKNRKNKKILLITGCINLLIVILSYILIGRTRNIAIFSDSGRSDINKRALEIFLMNPLLGIGFGKSNYLGIIPHNFIFQTISQGGLLYAIPLFIFIYTLMLESYKKVPKVFPTIICIMIGSLFIPDILNSRFFPVLALIISLH